jgi:hypothetical protein
VVICMWYSVTHVPEKVRFDYDKLDDLDPFEVDDDNRPHLFKHMFGPPERPLWIGLADILDLYVWDAVRYYEAVKGPADWFLVGQIERIIVAVPLAPPRSGDPAKCRPIGIYEATGDPLKTYLSDIGGENA